MISIATQRLFCLILLLLVVCPCPARGEDRNPARPQFTDHYFTGDYPTRLLDKEGETMGRKISVMASNG